MVAHLDNQTTTGSAAVEDGSIGAVGVVLSRVIHYVEDGMHVFRSTEFDIAAADEDRRTAVVKFVENAQDLVAFYRDLDDRTNDELHTAFTLMSRFNEVDRITREREEHAVLSKLRHRSRRRPGGGGHPSSRRRSSRLSPA